MKPNNMHTAPDQRFFFPTSNEVEHHKSFDTAGLPEVEHLPGEHHFVVGQDANGQETGYGVLFNHANIPAGTRVVQIAPVQDRYHDDYRATATFLEYDEYQGTVYDGLEVLDRDHAYTPAPDDQLLVQVDEYTRNTNRRRNPDFPRGGIMLLPAHEPLPTVAELGFIDNDHTATYSVNGIVTQDDRLIVPNSLHGNASRRLTDLCIAAALADNSLEGALVRDAISFGVSLVGLVKIRPTQLAYLEYFDSQHGTNFTPTKDPEYEDFPPMTDEQTDRYFNLTSLAHSFYNQRRP